ncbi:MAG: winged helix-turn-helix transcriptional regulator [Magnetococcales bacterium]|nr:winged helix-turn-helix transcriptional regulator [Magnetococcales bacterium]
MEILNAANLLAALGHGSRLAIFRLLIEAGAAGMHVGAIAAQVKLAPATLSFHLAHLSRVGLIRGRQEGRFIHYAADFATMDTLLAFLTHNCCQGSPCLPRSMPGAGVSGHVEAQPAENPPEAAARTAAPTKKRATSRRPPARDKRQRPATDGESP